jgi:HD domain
VEGAPRNRPINGVVDLQLSEVLSALSHALDITEGQVPGHAERSCLIGMRIAAGLDLDDDTRSSLFYALLLKGAGLTDTASTPQALLHVLRTAGSGGSLLAVDEHWDGGGYPAGISGDQISLAGRVLCLAQTAEVFWQHGGPTAACEIARQRRRTWFDPTLVDALVGVEGDARFWRSLETPTVTAIEPTEHVLVADDGRLDLVAHAFASIVDAKSPYTGRHSEGVAAIADALASLLDLDSGPRTTWGNSAYRTEFATSRVRSAQANGTRSVAILNGRWRYSPA